MGLVDWNTYDEWILGREILKQLIREVREAGARPFLVVIPPERWVKNEADDSLHKSLLNFSRREKVDLLDLTPELQKAVREYGPARYYLENNGHWTAEAHRFAADRIAAFVKGSAS